MYVDVRAFSQIEQLFANCNSRYNGGYFYQRDFIMDTLEKIKGQIANNTILLYMKGTPQSPQCGFSAQAVNALTQCGAEFTAIDILANPDIRQTLPQYANWPTFPQLYVKGELIGGCDIMLELYQQGELQKIIQDAMAL